MSKKIMCLVSLFVVLGWAGNVLAINIEWIGQFPGTNLWSDGDNWSSFFPPKATEDALVDVPDVNYTCIIDSTASAVAKVVYVGFYQRTAYLKMTGGTLTASQLRVGLDTGRGVVDVNGGIITLSSDSATGQGASADVPPIPGTGTLNMRGGTINHTAGLFIVGYNGGYGRLNMEAGNLNVASLRVAYQNKNETSDVNITGGKIKVNGDISVGQSATGGTRTGTFKMTGGDVNQPSGWFYAGFGQAGPNSVTLIDVRGGTLETVSLRTGPDAVADINVSGGYITIGNDPVLGLNPAGKGTLNMSGGTIYQKSGWLYMGQNGGTGIVNLTGGKISTPHVQWESRALPSGPNNVPLFDVAGGTVEIRRTDPNALSATVFDWVAYAAPRGWAIAYGGNSSFYITKDPVTGYILIRGCDKYLYADSNADGIVDLKDFAMLSGVNFMNVATLASEWLMCGRPDGTCP
jgi:hypothetical protein